MKRRIVRRMLKGTGFTILGLLLLAFLIPIVFKKQVQALVKREINKTLNAQVEFSDVSLSLFRHFPRVTVKIKNLSIVGKDIFSKDTLIATPAAEITAGLFSVLKGKDIKVQSLAFDQPRIHIKVKESGAANYDIAKKTPASTTPDTSSPQFSMYLKSYSINNGYLEYDDEQAHTYTEIKGLDHTGRGNLTAEIFTLTTKTKATSAYFVQDDIPYLPGTNVEINTDIEINNKTRTYTFNTQDINLNALRLNAKGFIQMIDNKTFNTDVSFKAPGNEFREILSMIPSMYTEEFRDIKTSGQAAFEGFVKGIISDTKTPSYRVAVNVRDGFFQYPDLPKPVKNIQLELLATNPDGVPDHSVLDITKGHLEMDNEPFDFHISYRQPVSAQYLDAAVKGKVDLAQLTRFIKLPAGTKLSGIVWADAFLKGPVKALQQQQGNFSAGGFFDIQNLYYATSNFPQPVQNGNIRATVNNTGGIPDNTTVDVSTGHVEVGSDPVDFSLSLKHPFSTIDFSGHAKGRLTLDHIKQFVSLPPGETISGILNADLGFSGSNADLKAGAYDRVSLNGTAALSNVNYKAKAYPTGIAIPAATLNFKEKVITVNNFNGTYLNTNFNGNGTLANLVGYIAEGQSLNGNLNISADRINLNEWMGENTDAPAKTSSNANTGNAFIVPAGINLTLDAKAGNVHYDKVDYNNISGTLLMYEQKITLKDIKTEALDGNIVINGSYSTLANKTKPDISFSYDIHDVDVQKAFYAFNTIQSLMPIGKFLAGKLHSQLSLIGNMDGEMSPLLNTLTGKGNLLLIEGVLSKFAPLEKIANVLQIDRLKSISVKDIRNYIEFSNGKVMVKPFTIRLADIEMEIGGIHGFDQSIDYAVKMKLPRSIMGSKGNTLVNDLLAKASAKGIPVKASETVNLQLKVTGSMSNPDVAVALKEMAGDLVKDIEQQAKDFAQAKLDSAKQKTIDSLNVLKKQAEDKIKEKLADKGIDTNNLSVKNVKDSLLQKAKDTIKKKLINKIFGKN